MQRWKLTALAAAAVASLGMHATDAAALALGRITVQSALGEPLRAEVELPEITAAEADSLRTSVASPEAYRARGIDYPSAVNGVRINLERRGNGRTVLTLRSDRPVNDPFVDLILEANWASGRIVRDYTLLIDPPNLRPAPTVTASPQIAPPAAPAVRQRDATPRTAPAIAASPSAPTAPATLPAERSAAGGASAGTVTVKPGETAGRLAAANKAANVSLDQMLVAMLRANPNAFVGGNVNRIRAGAVLEIPDEAAQQNTSADAARQFIVAQSKDFNEFRRKLATNAPSAQVAGAERSASGSVGVQVEENKPAATPDRLTLSKGSVRGASSPDAAAADKIAQQQQARASEERRREIDKNIRELQALKTASAPAPAASAIATSPATAPAANPAAPASGSIVPAIPAAPTVVPPAVPEPAAVPAASAPEAAASVPSSVASDAAAVAPVDAASSVAPAPTASAPQPAPTPVEPEAESGFLGGLFGNPLLPLLGGALLALLAGFGIYKAVQRRRGGQVDSSFLESRLQPDSFFGASGGQRVDTNHDNASSSSMAYSPSQLDAGGDVDPVAEADVYLAYGRDLQAEEILKEALRTTPNRVAVHVKLLEIYAKRNDEKAFESVASEALRVTRGEGPEWDRIAELGRQIDPSNRLYQPGGSSPAQDGGDAENTTRGALAAVIGGGALGAAERSDTEELDQISASDLDLDLDLDEPSGQPAETLEYISSPAPLAPAPAAPVVVASPAPLQASSFTPAPLTGIPEGLDFTLDDTRNDSAPVHGAATAPGSLEDERSKPARAAEPEMLDFDVDSLSFDVDSESPAGMSGEVSSAPAAGSAPELSADDPLATKLALAEEFNAIGDADGARALAEEVVSEASGDLKARAQRLLADMG